MADPRLCLLDLAVAYPSWRMERAAWAEAWGRRAGPGTIPLAGHDEDSLTLAADALAALASPATPGRHPGLTTLVVATTTSPHAERSTAAVLARAFGADPRAQVLDIGGALHTPVGAVAWVAGRVAQTGSDAVLVSADTRRVRPGADMEVLLGDAGAGARLGRAGSGGALAELIGSAEVTGDLPETWRNAASPYLVQADPAFAPRSTLVPVVRAAIEQACRDAGVAPSDVAAVAGGSADMRVFGQGAVAAGCGPGVMAAAGEAFDRAGFCGSAMPWVCMAAALARAGEGAVIVQVAAGGGSAAAAVWRAAPGAGPWAERGAGGWGSAPARTVPGYTRALRLRGELGNEPIAPYASMPLAAREEDQDLALTASQCPRCGRVDFPMRRVCVACGSRELGRRPLGRSGVVVTYTEDHVFPSPEPPTIMAVADMDGGGRLFAQVAGATAGETRLGAPVTVVLRRLHAGGDWTHYFWKLRLAARAGAGGTTEA